jgi:eukaryotic-like serine/threonine-protein kinase
MSGTLGHYRILDLIGIGPLGEIYRARDTRAGRTVAVTVVPDEIASDPAKRERFLRDARAAAAVSHPNILTLYEVGEEDGGLHLVHEYVQGQTLLRSIIGGRPINPRRAIDLASQIAEALADAHASDLAHGAITADSVVVTPKGNAKVANFGLAAWSSPGGAGNAREPVSCAADLHALGAILFEMLTGRAPAPGAAVPSAASRSLPRELDPIVAKALGMSGGYETAATLAAELRAVGAMLDVRKEASDAAAPPMVPARPRRSRAAWVGLAVAVAALAAAVWWYLRPV